MKILIIFGSNKVDGIHLNLKMKLSSLDKDLDFICLSEMSIDNCIACEKCKDKGVCVLSNNANDDFEFIFDKMKKTDAIIFVTPVYAPIPSKLASVFERLISITFFGYNNKNLVRPLEAKEVAILYYGAKGVCDNTNLKIMIQQLFTSSYSFNNIDYDYFDNGITYDDNSLDDYLVRLVNIL